MGHFRSNPLSRASRGRLQHSPFPAELWSGSASSPRAHRATGPYSSAHSATAARRASGELYRTVVRVQAEGPLSIPKSAVYAEWQLRDLEPCTVAAAC